MTKAELIRMLARVPDDAEVLAFDADGDGHYPVTGILFVPPIIPLVPGKVILQTDEL
jgi:hypothetical protein